MMTSKEFAEYIIKMTVKRIEFDATKLPLFNKPVVYMAVSDDECLYIGMSTKGLGRVFGKGHHILSVIYNEITNLEVYETRTEHDARMLERKMIAEFKPKYNDRQKIRIDRHNTGQIITRYEAL
jgi:excinuclease UvrABC nuclease subunit